MDSAKAFINGGEGQDKAGEVDNRNFFNYKEDKVMWFAEKWMQLETTIVSQAQEDKYYVFFHISVPRF